MTIFLRTYKKIISPIVHGFLFFLSGPTMGCRFSETCSSYMKRRIAEDGVLQGFYCGVIRLFRCW